MTRRAETPVKLRPDEDFARYVNLYGAQRREPDAADVAQVIARKHCAGRKGQVDGATILEALNANPNQHDGHGAANWVLSSIAPHECALLVTRCGVSPQALARHVRSRPVRREAIIRFLNQFAVAG
ncbi:MAG: hypothetical protein OXG29_09260 [Gammaproteobacteria bacterium]|nr:hypothetical protein [Gammaproteobacteria bacterium]